MGALALYLDFLNLFILLLQLTGSRRQLFRCIGCPQTQ